MSSSKVNLTIKFQDAKGEHFVQGPIPLTAPSATPLPVPEDVFSRALAVQVECTENMLEEYDVTLTLPQEPPSTDFEIAVVDVGVASPPKGSFTTSPISHFAAVGSVRTAKGLRAEYIESAKGTALVFRLIDQQTGSSQSS